MQTRTPLSAAAPLVAGAPVGWRAASFGLVNALQAVDKQARSAELDRIVRQLFDLANRHTPCEFNDPGRRLDG
jgi:hypothetical protein